MRVLCFLLLACLALSDATTTITFDTVESILQSQVLKLQSVEKVVDVKYLFDLIDGHRWTQFPDMNIGFNLTFPQPVELAYSISIGSHAACWMAVKMEIDGVEERFFRAHAGGISQHQFSRTGSVYLSQGEHRAIVSYRCDCKSRVMDTVASGWPIGIFKVHYHQIRTDN